MPHNLVSDTDVAAEHVTGHGKAKSFIFPRLCRQGAIVALSLSEGDRRIIGHVGSGSKAAPCWPQSNHFRSSPTTGHIEKRLACPVRAGSVEEARPRVHQKTVKGRSEEHTSELQS